MLSGRAQTTGSWEPAGADLRYPRTLLRATDLPAVQSACASGSSFTLYRSLYESASQAAPTDNTSASGRRARATLAKNAAFVLLLGRRPLDGRLVLLTEAEAAPLLAKVTDLLSSLNPVVEPFVTLTGTPSYTEWQWRSKELIDYLVAYDLLRGTGETEASLLPAQARLQEFAGNLYTQSTTPFQGMSFYAAVKNNHTLMTAAALGMAAVVLSHAGGSQPAQQPVQWIAAGLYNLDNVLWEDAQRQSDPTAVVGYAEGPYYFKYAFLNCLPFFRAMGHLLPDTELPYSFGGSTRRIRNPYYDPRYTRLYEWITAIMLPDGRFPALEDSYVDMGMPELALTGQRRFVRPLYLSQLSGTGLNSLTAQLRDITVDMRAAYLAANLVPTAPSHPALTVLPQSGNLIFRSGNDSLASYLHLYGKNGAAELNGGGHNQGDASSFLLFARGQQLALDPGYLSYARRAEVGQAAHHNLVLVDGLGPALGTPGAGAASATPAYIQNTLHTSALTYGEVQTAYQGASITRRALFVRNSYFLLADFAASTAPHTYTWQLHGAGLEGGTAATGTFTDKLAAQQATWLRGGAGLLAHVTAAGGADGYAKATNPHELTYNTAENHTTLLVRKTNPTSAQFLAALHPFTAAEGPAVTFTTTSDATTAGLAASSTEFTDVVFTQADTLLATHLSPALPAAVQADGQLTFYSADAAGRLAQAFVVNGTRLRYGAVAVLESGVRATVSWQRDATGEYIGYVSRATTLRLALAQAPTRVSGSGVASYRYEAENQQLVVALSQASSFTVSSEVRTSGNPLPVSLTRFTGQRQGAAVALAWHTATEQHNAGFQVQRSTTGGADFAAIGFVQGAGNSARPAAYTFRDAAASPATTYYRLAQTDQDGSIRYSPVVVAAGSSSSRLTVFPVPTPRRLHVTFPAPETEVTLNLVNTSGQTVLRQRFRQATELDLGSLAPGLYYLHALNNMNQPLGNPEKVAVMR